MAATVFTIANQKGGVGKTTTAINLGSALANRYIDTLIVDMDPQANSTSWLGFEKREGASIYGPLLGEGTAQEKILPTNNDHLFLIPSEPDLAAIETELANTPNYLIQLRKALESVMRSFRFDAIILDCPPSTGLISMNGLAAADYLMIALQCEYLALEGLGQILKVMDQIKSAGVNPKLELGGIIMTMYDLRTRLSQQVVDEVKEHFPNNVFNSIIPRSIRLAEAPSFGKSIFEYEPSSPGAHAYDNLAQEVIAKFHLDKEKKLKLT
ncbi:MAG: ParA family protein [Puniceicoccaceae bacterium]